MADYKRKIEQELALFRNLLEESPEVRQSSSGKNTDTYTNNITSIDRKPDNCMISTVLFDILIRKVQKARDIEIFSVLRLNIKIVLKSKKSTDLVTKLPIKFHDYFDIFSKAHLDLLPDYQPYNYLITLIKKKTPTNGPWYSISAKKPKFLKAYLEKMIDEGFIWASFFPAAFPVFFAKKLTGGLCFCVNYQQLNSITIKNCYLLPLIKETLERVWKAKIFRKIDIITAFNCLQSKYSKG